MKHWKFKFLNSISLMLLVTETGCKSVDFNDLPRNSVSKIFSEPQKFWKKNACVAGYLNFDRSNPMLANEITLDNLPDHYMIPLNFDHSPFYDSSNDRYERNSQVLVCGQIDFSKDCFDTKSSTTCVPGYILIRQAIVKRVK